MPPCSCSSSSPPLVISSLSNHLLSSPDLHSVLVSPSIHACPHLFCPQSTSAALIAISCFRPALQCCVTLLGVWRDDLALSVSPPSTPPDVPFSLITLPQPTSQELFIALSLSLTLILLNLFLVSLFLSLSLPSLFSFIIKCCQSVPRCAT